MVIFQCKLDNSQSEKNIVSCNFNMFMICIQVNPMYAAALEAVNSISPKCIDEIKRYQNPPASAVTVVTCLCHMFEVLPANWENGKALISQDK